ncbi:hypothetical protein FHG87_013071 [Trinorchestia longiramus]|nr:hypothetical protein FHG87_013071 [Trinorchestia longiramus]
MSKHDIVVNRMAPLQTNTATRLAFIDQSANRTQKVNSATTVGFRYDRTNDFDQRDVSLRQQYLAHRPIQRGCNALCHGLSTKRFKRKHLHKNSHHLKNSTYNQQQSNERRNQPSCLRTGRGSNNPSTNENCTRNNSPGAPTLYVPAPCRQDVSTPVLDVNTLILKKEKKNN